MSKTTTKNAKPKRKPTPAAVPIPVAGPVAQAVPMQVKAKPKRRRRRRSRQQIVAQRVLTDIKAKQREFLRAAGAMLSDALGFEVRVSLVRAKPDLSPAMRRAARMTKKQARRQIADSMHAPIGVNSLDDPMPF